MDLPFDTMSGGEHITVVDQHATAVEPLEVRQAGHPRELVCAGFLAANYTGDFVSFSAF